MPPRPEFTIVGGPNGSGKSTVLAILGEFGIALNNLHNADDLARGGLSAADAQSFVRSARDAAIRDRQSFTYESVMSHASHVSAMRAARDADFFVRLIFVTTDDPDINVARVANRVSLGGHSVPEDRIRDRYARSMSQTLLPAIDVADEALIYDNSHDGSGAALPVAHVIGFFVHRFATPTLLWPDRYLWPGLEASGRYEIVPVG